MPIFIVFQKEELAETHLPAIFHSEVSAEEVSDASASDHRNACRASDRSRPTLSHLGAGRALRADICQIKTGLKDAKRS